MNNKTREDWKMKILKNMKIDYIELSIEDWIIIFLALNNFKGVDSRQKLHTLLFFHPSINVTFKPTFIGVYSSEIEEAFKKLIETGYVRKIYAYSGSGETGFEYVLSEKGKNRARFLIKLLSEKWVFDNKYYLLKRGKNVLSELESIKKVHLDKDHFSLLSIITNKIFEENPEKLLLDAQQRELIKEVRKILEKRRT